MALPEFVPLPDVAPRKSIYNADLLAFTQTLAPDDPYIEFPQDSPDFKWRTWYAHDYEAIFRDIANYQGDPESRDIHSKSIIRHLIQKDLWFILYFIMEIPIVNRVFGIQVCNEVESYTADGGLSLNKKLFIWAREHLKSSTLTIALTVKRIVNNPECCTAIFSYKKPAADKFLSSIRDTLEKELMIQCFPDILYEKPETQSPSWSLQNGIRVKRKAVSRKENTVEAFGLIEGMPTGGHFDHRLVDDVETFDIAKSPDQMTMCFDAFEMSANLGSDGGTENIVGTFYSHIGPLVRIRDKKDINGNPMYQTSLRPATHDGTRNGKPVFLSQERLDDLKTSKHFDSQQLCNPTPIDILSLDSRLLKMIEPEFLPRDRYKFMIVDQAGGKDTKISNKKGDRWTAAVISVKPMIDDIGASDCYLEDFISDQFTHAEAIHMIVQMYLRNGYIRQLGVEKVGLSTTEIHVCDGLRAHGRKLSVESRTLVLLNPANRNTEERVEAALQWPLANGKLWMTTDIDESMRQKLIGEMNTFPYSHAEILNAWAYVYDIIKKFRFPTDQEKPEKTVLQIINSAPIRSDFW